MVCLLAASRYLVLKHSVMRGSMCLPLRTFWSIPKLGAWTGSPGKCKHLEHGEAENDEPDRGVRGEQGRLDKLAPQDDAQHSARHYCQERHHLHKIEMTSLSTIFSMQSVQTGPRVLPTLGYSLIDRWLAIHEDAGASPWTLSGTQDTLCEKQIS